MPLAPGTLLGPYEIITPLGAGGMGEVYRARDTRLDRAVAIKVLSSRLSASAELKARFEREAKAIATLQHPHICTLYDVGHQDGLDFLVMEYLEGETLADRLRRAPGHPLENDQVLALAAQIADALAAAHARGIVHRDIKPGNLFLTEPGQAKILDFGLALLPRRVVADATTDTDFAAGFAGGTLPYMAPELLRGEQGDARSDIYSLGATLFEMATGRRAFPSETATVLIGDILLKAPCPPRMLNPRIEPRLENTILRCLEKDPAQRFQSAAELLLELRSPTGPQPRQPPSVVVLYFENLSGAKDDEYLRDGITEDIITELTKIRTLRVFPRSAVIAFRDKPATAPALGRQLGAGYVLGGSLRRAGERLRVTVQLVDSHSGHSVWADRYDRQLKDVFELQDEIARNVSQALRIALSPQEEEAIAHKPTESHQAYDDYLRGRAYARRCTHADLELAIQMFERAIGRDPSFALAHAGLSTALALLFDWHDKNPRWIERALAASDAALALSPDQPEGLAARARIFWSERNYDQAITFALRAVERKPDCENAYWTLGQAYFASDRWAEAAALAERAIEVSGADYNVYVPYMMAFERLGQHEAARGVRQRHVRALEQHLDRVPEDVRAHILLADNQAFFGDEEAALRHISIALELRPNDSNILYNAACTYGILGKKSQALAAFTRAVDSGFDALDYAARDPDLECIREDPEFQRALDAGRKPMTVVHP